MRRPGVASMALDRSTPLLLKLYGLGMTAISPIGGLYAKRRLARGKEDPARIGERKGFASVARPPGTLAWLHGASVGEFLSIVPLVKDLQASGVTVLVTTVTKTAAAVAAERLPAGAIHQFMPWDVPAFVDRFLDHWRPEIAIFAESELWPNMILRTTGRGVPLIQINGRMSQHSYDGWRRVPHVATALLSRFELCLVQTPKDAQRVSALGAPRVETTGNLKYDVPAPPADPAKLKALTTRLAGRLVLLAASTHEGEDEIVLDAHRSLALRFSGLLTILAPRHPHRGDAIRALAETHGLAVEQRSRGFEPSLGTAVYVADTIGEMGLFYRVATVAFVGGSLIEHGGQNPIEPAKLGAPILHGPNVSAFQAVYAAIGEAGGAIEVVDAASLAEAAGRLLADRGARLELERAAAGVVEGLGGAFVRTRAAIQPYLLDLKLKAQR